MSDFFVRHRAEDAVRGIVGRTQGERAPNDARPADPDAEPYASSVDSGQLLGGRGALRSALGIDDDPARRADEEELERHFGVDFAETREQLRAAGFSEDKAEEYLRSMRNDLRSILESERDEGPGAESDGATDDPGDLDPDDGDGGDGGGEGGGAVPPTGGRSGGDTGGGSAADGGGAALDPPRETPQIRAGSAEGSGPGASRSEGDAGQRGDQDPDPRGPGAPEDLVDPDGRTPSLAGAATRPAPAARHDAPGAGGGSGGDGWATGGGSGRPVEGGGADGAEHDRPRRGQPGDDDRPGGAERPAAPGDPGGPGGPEGPDGFDEADEPEEPDWAPVARRLLARRAGPPEHREGWAPDLLDGDRDLDLWEDQDILEEYVDIINSGAQPPGVFQDSAMHDFTENVVRDFLGLDRNDAGGGSDPYGPTYAEFDPIPHHDERNYDDPYEGFPPDMTRTPEGLHRREVDLLENLPDVLDRDHVERHDDEDGSYHYVLRLKDGGRAEYRPQGGEVASDHSIPRGGRGYRDVAEAHLAEDLAAEHHVEAATWWEDGFDGPGSVRRLPEVELHRDPRARSIRERQRIAVWDYVRGALEPGDYGEGSNGFARASGNGWSFPEDDAEVMISNWVVNNLGVPLDADYAAFLGDIPAGRLFSSSRYANLHDAARRGMVRRLQEIQRHCRIRGNSWSGDIVDEDNMPVEVSDHAPDPGDFLLPEIGGDGGDPVASRDGGDPDGSPEGTPSDGGDLDGDVPREGQLPTDRPDQPEHPPGPDGPPRAADPEDDRREQPPGEGDAAREGGGGSEGPEEPAGPGGPGDSGGRPSGTPEGPS
jgi:hypothetical protein